MIEPPCFSWKTEIFQVSSFPVLQCGECVFSVLWNQARTVFSRNWANNLKIPKNLGAAWTLRGPLPHTVKETMGQSNTYQRSRFKHNWCWILGRIHHFWSHSPSSWNNARFQNFQFLIARRKKCRIRPCIQHFFRSSQVVEEVFDMDRSPCWEVSDLEFAPVRSVGSGMIAAK